MKFIIFTLLIFSSANAYAFPLADGAGTVSTLIGVIASIIFSVVPDSSKVKKRLVAIVSVALLTITGLLCAVGFYYIKYDNYDNQIRIVRQSRPDIQLNHDVYEREKVVYSEPSEELVSFIDNYKNDLVIFSDKKWKNQSKSENLEMIVVGFRSESMVDKAYSFKRFTKQQEFELFNYLENITTNPVLHSFDDIYALEVVRKYHEMTGKLLPVYSADTEGKKLSLSDDVFVEPSSDIFNRTLYDLRNDKNIRETHTLVNAKIYTTYDLALTPNWKLRELFDNKNVIFTSYYEDYEVANYYLSEAGVKQYKFLKGGLQAHFENENLTPQYYNNRVLEPELVNHMYTHGNSLKFICMSEKLCLDNLPKGNTYVISYRDMDRESYFESIRNLPSEYIYVTVSSNQETAGLAIMTGYELIRSGHNYLGELPAFSRFSLEEVRHYIGENYTYETSLKEFQNSNYSMFDFSLQSKQIIADYGWVLYFMMAGVVCRLICFPFQYKIYAGYYRNIKTGFISLLAGLGVPVFIIVFYLKLDSLISDYAIINHLVIDDFFKSDYEFLKWIFILLVAFQAKISFPSKPIIYCSIITLVLGVYVFGYMDYISLPMMVFLLSGEIISISLQLPFYISYKIEYQRQRSGWATMTIKNGMKSYPEKWEYLVNNTRMKSLLVHTGMTKDLFMSDVIKKLPTTNLIVRSSSTSYSENNLGGYYESYITDIENAHDKLTLLNKMGCDFCFIQEYISSNCYGVASSLSKDGKGIHYAKGKHSDVTEGSSNVSEFVIDRKSSHSKPKGLNKKEVKSIRHLIFKLERTMKMPVVVEFSVSDYGEIELLQVRKQVNTSSLCFFPSSIAEFTLAEDYIAKSSYTNGSLLNIISDGDFVHADGFVYRKKKIPRKSFYTKKNIINLGVDIENLYTDTRHSESTENPLYWLEVFKQAMTNYKAVYRASQSFHMSECESTFKARGVVISATNHELDIQGVVSADVSDEYTQLNKRDYLHRLITLNICTLNLALRKFLKTNVVPDDIDIRNLLDGVEYQIKEPYYSERPLTDVDSSILHHGSIVGKPWSIDSKDIPKKKGYVLIGEEIGSEWVRNLAMFSGIISVYGNENSHLAISARELNIPYRKVTDEEFLALKEKEEVNLV